VSFADFKSRLWLLATQPLAQAMAAGQRICGVLRIRLYMLHAATTAGLLSTKAAGGTSA